VMEQALYNTVLGGMALDGKSFFYVNPLEVFPKASHEDERKHHVKPVRQKWFGCACCPPNLARILSSLPTYAFTENDDTLFVHMYMSGIVQKETDGKQAAFEMTTNYPWEETVAVKYTGEAAVRMKLALRIPGWCKEFKMIAPKDKICTQENGYYYVEGVWNPGDSMEVELPMQPMIIAAHANVREDIGKVAVVKGPITYCMEEHDNGKDLHLYKLRTDVPIKEGKVTIEGQRFPTLIAKGLKQIVTTEDTLYRPYQLNEYEDVEITLIPYYAWANRGENEMSVWIRV